MHTHSLQNWQHEHAFLGEKHAHHERRTGLVVALTAVMMMAEIIGGTLFGSMALVADGWHMSTHAAALGIAALAYRYIRTYACTGFPLCFRYRQTRGVGRILKRDHSGDDCAFHRLRERHSFGRTAADLFRRSASDCMCWAADKSCECVAAAR